MEAAQRAGHDVTLFNRGRTQPELFPELTKLRGDRDGDLSALESGRWDAVIDTSGYTPSAVRASAETLSSRADHYTFISTISVYREPLVRGQDESAPLHEPPKDDTADVGPDTYGPLKAGAEAALAHAFEGTTLIIRPGLIVGPHDPTDRFTYWPSRLARGGEVLAPGKPERQVQFIDVRDLADWCLELAEAGIGGVFNASGPKLRMSMAQMLQTIMKGVQGAAQLTWIPEDYLLDAGVQPWTGIPLWLPESLNALLEVSIQAALDHGLNFRPLADTAADTLAWDHSRGTSIVNAFGLNPARELALLEAWHARKGAG